MQSRESNRWLPATAPHLSHPSADARAKPPLFGVVSGRCSGYGRMQKLRGHRCLQVWAHHISVLSPAVWKREEHAKGQMQEKPWGPSLIHGTRVLGCYEHCLETGAAFHIFFFAKLLIPQHLEIPRMSVNLKYRPLPNA